MIIVKIGTESLENFETSEKVNRMVRDISTLIQEYKERILLVSSWAVWAGRKKRPDINDKKVLAQIGWTELMSGYDRKFWTHTISVGWLLLTHADITDYDARKKTLLDTVKRDWENNILPIANENDPIATEEMIALKRGADNDKNALLLAELFHASAIFIITSENGCYRDKDDSSTRIPMIQWTHITPSFIENVCWKPSKWGTGWMGSKLEVWRDGVKNWITTYICDWIHSWILDHYSGNHIGGTIIHP